MRIKIISLVCLVFFGTSSLFAQGQIVYECAGKLSIKDRLLHLAIEKTVADSNSIEFQTEDSPCNHKKYIVNAFNRTFNRKIFSRASGYSFSLLKKNEDPFSIERFVFRNKQDAVSVSKIISRRKINNLQIESLTYYDFFLSGNDLIFFIADRQSFNENQHFFRSIKETFLEYKKSKK